MLPEDQKIKWLDIATKIEKEKLIETAVKLIDEYETLKTQEWRQNYSDILEMFRAIGKFRFDQSFVIEYNKATNNFLVFKRRLKHP